MARDGKQEEEIWKTISERFKSTMALVEKQVLARRVREDIDL